MAVESHHPGRKPILALFVVSVCFALVALLAASNAAAQGTPEQRAACEEEARWLCSNYIPDVEAIKSCMLRNVDQLSPRCRAVFGPKRRGGHARHGK